MLDSLPTSRDIFGANGVEGSGSVSTRARIRGVYYRGSACVRVVGDPILSRRGHVCGIIARAIRARGHKAPANEIVNGRRRRAQ